MHFKDSNNYSKFGFNIPYFYAFTWTTFVLRQIFNLPFKNFNYEHLSNSLHHIIKYDFQMEA